MTRPKTIVDKFAVRERLLPYKGPWHLAWVIHRYLWGTLGAMSLTKLLNATLALIEMKCGFVRVRSRPFVLRIEPCNVCNLRCPLCACGTGNDPRPNGFMSFDAFRQILEQTSAMALVLRLDGMGEPTLHPQILEMIRLAKSYKLSVTLHSNFNTEKSKAAEEFVASGLDRLVVDIDGATQESYARYRVGGNLERASRNFRRLVEVRRQRHLHRPIMEIQSIEFDWNRDELPLIRAMAEEWGADRFTVCSPERTAREAPFNDRKPRRCFWLWTTLTIGWDLNYRSCTNAWSLPWPRLSFREVSPREWWNHHLLCHARRYNIDKSSSVIGSDTGCKCSRCYEMLVAPLQGPYFCE